MGRRARRGGGLLRRGARRTGEEVAGEAVSHVAWRVATAPLRLLIRAIDSIF